MKTLVEYILEGQVDGLKDVKIIRHYTTSAGLLNILKNGYIEARESEGDDDWKAYDLFDKKVVSFHDERTDPEWDTFIEHNSRKISMAGCTPTLGLHDKKVCACIEIDYDKLDKLIQDRTHLLNIYGKKAEEFANKWNAIIENSRENNGIIAFYKCKVDFCQFLLDTINGDDEKLKASLEHIWDQYGLKKKKDDPESQPALSEIRKIFLKYYTEDELDKQEDDSWYSSYNETMFISEISRYFGWGLPGEYPSDGKYMYQIKDELEYNKRLVNFYTRANLRTFTDEEIEQLSEYAIKFDVVSVVKMMHRHGWRLGDSKLNTIFGGYRGQLKNGKYADGTMIWWIDALMKSKKKIVNANIEIRIPANVELNSENCKIIIFDGICEAIDAKRLLNLPKKYDKLYNIEHIK